MTASFRSVPDLWTHRVRSTPESYAMKHRDGAGWRRLTWREADARATAIAAGLLAASLRPGERVAIQAVTSVPWILADIGVVLAGGATTTIYPQDTLDQAVFILRDCGAVVLFCDSDAQADAVRARAKELPALRHIITLHGVDRAIASGDGPSIEPLAAWEARGRQLLVAHPGAVEGASSAVSPHDPATLIYTSGTTGRPKGVVLSHDAWVYEGEAIDRLGVVGPDDVQLLFLPLAHVFAKVMQLTFIRLGVPTAVDGSMDRFLQNMADVRPTWIAAVPRVFEKAWARIEAEVHERGAWADPLFARAVDLGIDVARARRSGASISPRQRLGHAVADRVIFAPIRQRFGGRLRFAISGGAPLAAELAEKFDACGITLCEGYGLTESAAASCVNTPDGVVFGTVGRPVPGCSVRIADDGEILLRSRGVMTGYHGLPEATAEALGADGWLHTGDIGRVLPTGHLQITGRKKEILVTAGGKNIAPAHFEGLLRARSGIVAHVVMLGDRHSFCSALVSLDAEQVTAWATREGITLGELHADPRVRESVQQAIDDVNRELPSHEKVRRFAVVPEPFTVDNGLLTPSLKPKRHEIEARYAELVATFYGAPRPAVAQLAHA